MKNQRKNLIKTISISLLAFFAPSVVFADESTDLESFKAGDDYILSTVDEGATIDDATYIKDITKYVYDTESKSYVETTYGVYAYTTTTSAEVEGEIVDTTTYDGYVSNNATSASTGGAVNNTTDNSYESDFINNSATSTANAASTFTSGAIYNSSTLSVVGDFVGNYVSNNNNQDNNSITDDATKNSFGGAIYNATGGSITSLSGDFTNNYAYSNTFTTGSGNIPTAIARGGAIYSAASIGDIVGDFNGNYASAYVNAGFGTTAEKATAQGGAIYSSTTINSIDGDFIGNYVQADAQGGSNTRTILAQGGAIYNSGTISSLNGDFIDNYAKALNATATGSNNVGGAIFNSGYIGTENATDTLSLNFSGNYVQATVANALGGGIYNAGTFYQVVEGELSSNYAYTTSGTSRGGAIYNSGTISISGALNSNYAQSTSGTAQGGAIYNLSTISFVANTESYTSSGNWAGASKDTASDANGGFLYQTADGDTTFDVGTDLKITIGEENCVAGYDSIAGLGTITKDGAGSLVVNSSMEYYTGTLTVSAGSMEVNNTLGASTISIAGDASLSVDVLAIYLGETSSSLSLTNEGTLSIGTLAIYLSEDFEVGDSVALNTGEYDFTDSVTDYVVYDFDGELLDDSLYSYSIEGGSFTLNVAVPEPSTYAMILGALALGFAYYRRRK